MRIPAVLVLLITSKFLAAAASLDDGALIPLVVVMLIGAGVGAFIGAARRRA